MGDCNYCRLKRLKKAAKKDGNRVTKRRATGPMGGWNIFVHPKEIKIPAKGTSIDLEPYFMMWACEIGKNCSCDE